MTDAIVLLLLTSSLGQTDRVAASATREQSVTTQKSESRAAVIRVASHNFDVVCPAGVLTAEQLAAECEHCRDELSRFWKLERPAKDWSSRCIVVVHASRAEYLAAAGAGAQSTVGSSLVRFDGARVVARRIDLLASDGAAPTSALAHEMVHILFADWFPDRAPPKWAEEGAALLVDDVAKQHRHHADLLRVMATGGLEPTHRLLATEGYPDRRDLGAFYGHSAAVVRMLVQQRPPHHFLEYVELATDVGYDEALRRIYDLKGAGDLEWQFRRHLTSAAPSSALLARINGSDANAVVE